MPVQIRSKRLNGSLFAHSDFKLPLDIRLGTRCVTVRLLSSADDHNLAARLLICYLQGGPSNEADTWEVSIMAYVWLYPKRQSVDERSDKIDFLALLTR
ncbi:hypothetical protein C2L65_16610 [Paraburkholderia terrae]|uniref:Uncharacterized protein n=1 Tax=Paraburkholderia terrae TaxID=311230 RepID=A0A2I8EPD3_9BURK|nr:hypothetical protein C2L65_16610 [Paraburkholderia terrae]